MGTCSSARAGHHQEDELTDVLIMYSKLVQPDVFAFLIDFLKQHEIISKSWKSTYTTKKSSSAPRTRHVPNAEKKYRTSEKEEKDDSSKTLLEQQRENKNQEDEIKLLTDEIKSLREKLRTLKQRSTESAEFRGDHESNDRNVTIERKGDVVHSTADKPTRLKQEQQITRINVCLTGKETEHINKEMSNDVKQLMPKSQSIQEQYSTGKTDEKGICNQSACEEERTHFLLQIKQYEETIGKLKTNINMSENNKSMWHDTKKQATGEEKMANLSSKIAETEQKNKVLKKKLDASEDEVKALRLNRGQLIKDLKSEQQKHQTTRAEFEKQEVSLRGDNTLLSSTVGKFQQNISLSEKRLGVSEDKLKTLRLKKDQLTSELETEQQKHHTTRTDLGEQIESLRRDNTVLSSTVEKLQRNADVLERQLCVKEEEIKTLQLNKGQITSELETKQRKHHITRTDFGEQIVSLKGDNNVLSSTVEKLQRNVDVLERQLSVKLEELKTVQSNKDQLTQELKTEQQTHHTTRTDLGKQIALLKGDNNVLSSTVEMLQQNVDVVARQLCVKQEELKTVQSNKDQLTSELETEQQKHHTTRTDLGEQIASLRGDNTVLSSTVEMLQRNVGVLEKQLANYADELKTAKINKDILAKELGRKQQTCSDLEEHNVSLKGDIIAMSSEIEKLKRDVAMMERQLDAEYQQTHRTHLEAGENLGMLELYWRVEPIFDQQYLENLKDEVEKYWPLRDMGVSVDALQYVNILFIGPIGAGKSSFLNSVESTFRGHVTLTATAGSRTKSVTSMYRQHSVLASDNRHPMKFRLCDCRGLEDRFGISRDIDSILEGNMPDGYVFNNSFPFTRKTHGYKHNPSLEDRIHCVVYVLDAETYSKELGVPFVSEPVRNQIKTMQEAIDQRGIPQLAILSKVDNICESTKQNTAMVYRSTAIRQRCIDAAGCLGLPPMTVMPMKNYFWETSTTDDISILALYNIRQMLRAADSFLRANHLDELRADKHK